MTPRTDAFGDPTSNDFMKTVSDIALNFLYLGIAAIVGSYLEAAVWMYTGNRQTNRLRTRFLAAVLNQDVAFFDVQSTTGKWGIAVGGIAVGEWGSNPTAHKTAQNNGG